MRYFKYVRKIASLLLLLIVGASACSDENSIATSNTDDSSIVSNGTLEALAEECCKCWSEAKSINNSVGRARKIDVCTALTIQKLTELQEIGVTEDWTDEQVESARKSFDNIYNKCE